MLSFHELFNVKLIGVIWTFIALIISVLFKRIYICVFFKTFFNKKKFLKFYRLLFYIFQGYRVSHVKKTSSRVKGNEKFRIHSYRNIFCCSNYSDNGSSFHFSFRLHRIKVICRCFLKGEAEEAQLEVVYFKFFFC